MWEKQKIIWRNSKRTRRIQISLWKMQRRKAPGHVDVFCQTLGITAYTLENYSNFKSISSFNNWSIFEIHDYFRTRENARFNDLSQLINTLSWSNQDFSCLGNLFCTPGVARKLYLCSKKEKKENWRKKRSFDIIELCKT